MTSKPIVVGTDGSPESIQAVGWAAREAQLRGTGLRIISAEELLPRMYPPPRTIDIETIADALRRNQDWALSTAAKAAAGSAPDVQVETVRLTGDPALAVTDAGADALMLAVGSRGSSAFAAMTIGSVGRYAATHASCPVVVVRDVSMVAHRQVVVGIRDVHDGDAALGFAFGEASLRSASLVVVHAWHLPRTFEPSVAGFPDTPVSPSADEVDENVARQFGEQLTSWSGKYPNVKASEEVVNGHPGRVLAGLSARADLVVLGRHSAGHRPGAARVIHAVLAHAHGPVAVVPSE
jgi:nucleotide-binding universal stress UspA family protein